MESRGMKRAYSEEAQSPPKRTHNVTDPGPAMSMYNEEDNVLGFGSFGTVRKCVLKARHSKDVDKDGKRYPFEMAIKVLLNNDQNKYLQRETDICSGLKHKNIIEVYGVEKIHPNVIIKMELADMSLAQCQERKRSHLYNRGRRSFHVFEFDNIATQIAQGLAYLHGRNIAHRDIKPHNVLLFIGQNRMATEVYKQQHLLDTLRYVMVKLCDFGLSRFMSSSLQSQSVVGTRAYFAPEIAKAKHKGKQTVDSFMDSDIFSAGVLFFELLTNNLPFKWEELIRDNGDLDFTLKVESSKLQIMEFFHVPLPEMLQWDRSQRLSANKLAEMFIQSKAKKQMKFQELCGKGLLMKLKLFIEKGFDLNFADEDGITPLIAACCQGHSKVVQHLIEKGADVNKAFSDGCTPLHCACFRGHLSIVQVLISNGAVINMANRRDETPLHYACYIGKDPVAQLLINNGADVNKVEFANGWTPLHFACREGHLAVVELLVKSGADVNITDKCNDVLLLDASHTGHLRAAEIPTKKGKLAKRTNHLGNTPIISGHLPVSQILNERGALVKGTGNDGWTPLHWACMKGHFLVSEFLIDNDADVNRADSCGRTPLHYGCYNRDIRVAKLLIEKGAIVNAADNSGMAPLHLASFNGHLLIAQLLIEKRAEINKADKMGKTPLHIACKCGYPLVVKLLIMSGADVTKEDSKGRLALHNAKRNGHVYVENLLGDTP